MQKGRLPKSLFSPTYERFLAIMRQARIASGVTQIEVAERLGRPQSFVSKCESGERRVDMAEFLAICQAIQTDPHEIIDRLLERPRPANSGSSK